MNAPALRFVGHRRWAGVRVLALIALALVSASVTAQPRYGLSPEAFAVYERWLAATCVGDEARALVTQLRLHAAELSRAFPRAITDGPPAAEIGAVRVAAEQRFDARSKFPLPDYDVSGVNADALARFRGVSRDDFVNDQVRRYVLGYRSNAVAALGVLGDARSRALLARIANNPRDPLAAAAREALKAPRSAG